MVPPDPGDEHLEHGILGLAGLDENVAIDLVDVHRAGIDLETEPQRLQRLVVEAYIVELSLKEGLAVVLEVVGGQARRGRLAVVDILRQLLADAQVYRLRNGLQ